MLTIEGLIGVLSLCVCTFGVGLSVGTYIGKKTPQK